MIDLQPSIRQYVLNDTEFISELAEYQNSKAVFTRRPVPEDATYPLAIVSPIVGEREVDFISCYGRRILTYDIIVYSNNDSSESYRSVERAAYRLTKILHRVDRTAFSLPSGVSLIATTASSPFRAPTDDFVKIARGVTVNIDILLEN